MSPRKEVAAPPPPPPRILIVDDEPHNRALLEVMLAPEGFVLQAAATGEDALAMVHEEAPDLILLDVMMPGMDGYQVTAAIKDDPATSNIPIIMVTALDDHDARMLGLNAGAEDFLSKPLDRAELRARVRNLLRLKAAIAEARDARLMAEHANAAKTLFLRAMSHELRTPLNAITGYAELLELGIHGAVNADQLKDLGRIRRASEYLFRLINDVLTMARLGEGRPLRVIPVAINAVLAETEGLCGLQAEAKGVTLTITPHLCETSVAADPERFQQILLNLVTNAIKFTPSGGSVGITCDADDTVMRIRVADTGVGIGVADVDRVFEPFVQVDQHLTVTSQRGVGLGLSISRELARSMHGDLTLESSAGHGATFTLTLPITTGGSSSQRSTPLAADGAYSLSSERTVR
jgi:signal transduction histidine kinase